MNTKTLSVGDRVTLNEYDDAEAEVKAIDFNDVCVKIDKFHGLTIIGPMECKPIPSKEDRAVEEMEDVWRYSGSATITEIMRTLYRAGYRKKPPVDMDDPANWNIGDIFKEKDSIGSDEYRLIHFRCVNHPCFIEREFRFMNISGSKNERIWKEGAPFPLQFIRRP